MTKGDRAPKEKKKPQLSIKERQDKKKAKQEAKRGMA
jgi:hypothetical protein